MMKIVTVVGARPQFIKAAMLSMEFKKNHDIEEVVIHTGQHFDDNMSKVFFDEMGLSSPDYYLNINSMSHGAMTGRMIEAIERLLLKENPDCLIVYGDTNSTLAGALAAVKLQIPVVHVEAGIRAGYYLPEEVNRVVTDNLSEMLFCPCERAVLNLNDSGISSEKIFNVGDIVYDATLHYMKLSDDSFLNRNGLIASDYVLLTLHREENIDDILVFSQLIQQLFKLAEKYKLVIPLHPRTKSKLIEVDLYNEFQEAVVVLEPQPYLNMLSLIKNSLCVITDSGGLQKEAYYLSKKAFVLKQKTEWPELLQTGWVSLISPENYCSLENIVLSEITTIGNEPDNKPYGDGNTAQLIASYIKKHIVSRDKVCI